MVKVSSTKNHILSAFISLAKQNSFAKVTVKQITETAGINRRTFYTHFDSIYDLVDFLKEQLIADCKIALQPLLEYHIRGNLSLADAIKQSVAYLDSYSDPILVISDIDPDFFPLQIKIILKDAIYDNNLIEASNKKLNISETEIEYIVYFIITGIAWTSYRWLTSDKKLPKQTLEHLIYTYTAGILEQIDSGEFKQTNQLFK